MSPPIERAERAHAQLPKWSEWAQGPRVTEKGHKGQLRMTTLPHLLMG